MALDERERSEAIFRVRVRVGINRMGARLQADLGLRGECALYVSGIMWEGKATGGVSIAM